VGPRQLRAILALIVASALFGAIGATASAVEVGPLRFSFLIAAGATLPLLWLGRRIDRDVPARMGPARIGALAALTITQASLYVGALIVGPVGPVAAIHLSVPVVYLVVQLVTRKRPLDVLTWLVLALIIAGIALAAQGETGDATGSDPLLGVLLALGSVIALAAYLWLVSVWGRSRRVREAAGWVQVTTLVVLFPSLGLGVPSPADLGLVIVAGAVLFVPAVLTQWWALPRLAPTVFGIVILSEAVFTAGFAALIFGDALSPLVILAGVIIVLATGIEVSRTRGGVPGARPGDGDEAVGT
jgi:drug/metabolite transporter (DMT)-like permease